MAKVLSVHTSSAIPVHYAIRTWMRKWVSKTLNVKGLSQKLEGKTKITFHFLRPLRVV